MSTNISDTPNEETKTCPDCKKTLPLSDFDRRSDYPEKTKPYCHDCNRERKRVSKNKNYKPTGRSPGQPKKPVVDGKLECSVCKVWKELDAFKTDARNSSGRTSMCRDCSVEYNRGWREENKEKVQASGREAARTFREKNRSRIAFIVPARKLCYICSVEKEASDFYRETGQKDGLSARCKECGKSDRGSTACPESQDK